MVHVSLVVGVLATIPPHETEDGKVLTNCGGIVINTTPLVTEDGKVLTDYGGIVNNTTSGSRGG